jgi:NAD(P)-dependent dehydrogenase (short-subunit alcohol dehydrogenase family)
VNTSELRGKSIAITGASAGIGLATARACAHAGMSVALGARRLDRLEAVAAEIRAAGGRAVAIACDVSDEPSCFAFVERAAAELGPLHAVFANAGYGVEVPSLEMTDPEWELMLRTNFWGTLWTVRAAVNAIRGNASDASGRRGHLLVCSSCVSKIGAPYHAAYSASKACQDHLARALRHELRAEGIAVSSIHPVGTSTEFFDQLERRSPASRGLSSASASLQSPDRVARAIVRCLHHPVGEVWTSTPTRFALALATAFPGLADWGVDRFMRKRKRSR